MNHLQSDFPEHDAPLEQRFERAAKFAIQHSVQNGKFATWNAPLPFKMTGPFFQAGLAGYSDAAMRCIARKHGCDFCVTEAMLDHFLLQGGKGLDAAKLWSKDHPIAGQLMGSHPEDIAKGAKILVELGYDVIDVNLACPVKKIKKKARGGHLLKDPVMAREILMAVRDAVPDHLPTSLKLRRGSDNSSDSEQIFFTIYDEAMSLGYELVTVHGRTVEQKYHGPSTWAFLKRLAEYTQARKSDKPFYLFGSGDIWDAADIFSMIQRTGVDGVSVARGCIGNPWIFFQARALMAGNAQRALKAPSVLEQKEVLLAHFQDSVRLHGESQASRMMRKFGIRFSQHHPDSEAVKKAFISVKSSEDWQTVLDELYSDDLIPPTNHQAAFKQVLAEEVNSCE